VFEHLDDPQPPVTTSVQREKVAARARELRRRRRALTRGATALVVVLVAASGITTAVVSNQTAQHAKTAAGPSSTSRTHDRSSASQRSATDDPYPQTPAGLAKPGFGVSSIPPTPPPCPKHALKPSDKTGRYCGPAPHAGNGLGPGGECTGQESKPPCGPGVVVGRYYAYTLPVKCNGLIVFDGRRWYATLTPPTDEPDIDVWMRLESTNSARWISSLGSVGFIPDTGQSPPVCS
jgi:hypothetical protein